MYILFLLQFMKDMIHSKHARLLSKRNDCLGIWQLFDGSYQYICRHATDFIRVVITSAIVWCWRHMNIRESNALLMERIFLSIAASITLLITASRNRLQASPTNPLSVFHYKTNAFSLSRLVSPGKWRRIDIFTSS